MNQVQREIWQNNYKSPEDQNIEDTFKRVAKVVSDVEQNLELRKNLFNQFFNMMNQMRFIPGGRTLANAGVQGRQKATLYNCFVYHPYDVGIKDIDSMEGIFQMLAKSSKILASQGGLGVNFTFIRPNGSFIRGTNARTPGVLKFMQLWDKSSQIITMGTTLQINDKFSKKTKKKIRKGALLSALDVSHSDIFQFIRAKQQPNKFTKFNFSVLIPNRFIKAVENDEDWKLGFPDIDYPGYKEEWDGDLQDWILKEKPFIVSKTIKAKQLWNEIILSTYNRNEPGVLFYDNLNYLNPGNYCQKIITTNPCIAGDTLIQVVNKENPISIRQLAELGEDFYVYSMNPENLKMCIKLARAPRKTRQNVKLVEIKFKLKDSIKCTPDHEFYIFDNELCDMVYKKAKDLQQWDSIPSFYHQKLINSDLSNEQNDDNLVPLYLCIDSVVNLQETQDVYNVTVDDTHMYAIKLANSNRGIFIKNCGQIGMSTGVCNLGTLNLTKFYKDGEFDYNNFYRTIKYAVFFLDNVNQLSYIPLKEYENQIKNKRRIGLGCTGLGSLLYMMGIKFGSAQAQQFVDKIFKFKAETQLTTSSLLGKFKGSFKLFDSKKYFNTIWWRTLSISKEVKKDIENLGTLRNMTHSMVAPCGNSSLFLGNVSNGIQPVFMKQYQRWITVSLDQSLKLKKKGYKIPIVQNGDWYETRTFKFSKRGNQQILKGTIDSIQYQIDKNRGLAKKIIIRDYGYDFILKNNLSQQGIIEVPDLSVDDHINMLAITAKYINQSQSKTINVPKDYKYEDFKDIYLKAWNMGIKGVTTYRDGTMSAVLQKKSDAKKYQSQLQKLFHQNEGVIFQDVKIPSTSYALHYKIKDKNKKKWYVTLSFVDKQNKRPFALFIKTNCRESTEITDKVVQSMDNLALQMGINQKFIFQQKQKSQGQTNVDKIGRAIGLCLRHNIPIVKIIERLQQHSDGISTLLFHIRRILGEFIKDGTKIQGKKCQNCGSQNLIYQSGCKSCLDCANSKCE